MARQFAPGEPVWRRAPLWPCRTAAFGPREARTDIEPTAAAKAATQDPNARISRFGKYAGYSARIYKGFELSSDEAKKFMPDMNKPTNAYVDDGWWANNYVNLQKRYTEWMIV